jgi:hypothetical protein
VLIEGARDVNEYVSSFAAVGGWILEASAGATT